MKNIRFVTVILALFLLLNLSSVSAQELVQSTSEQDQPFVTTSEYSNEDGLNLEQLFPEASSKLKEDWRNMFPEGAVITNVTKVNKYYKTDESGKLVPLTNSDANIISPLGVGSGSTSYLTLYITSAYTDKNSGVEQLFGGSFQWSKKPTLDQGNSAEGFGIAWAGNLPVSSYSATLHYDEGDLSPSPATINPNAGVGWEFKEAIDKGIFKSNWYLESGSFVAKAYQNFTVGADANVVANYLHTSEVSTINSIGITIGGGSFGGSIGWSTSVVPERVAASTTFHY